jgi:hypothetical protein
VGTVLEKLGEEHMLCLHEAAGWFRVVEEVPRPRKPKSGKLPKKKKKRKGGDAEERADERADDADEPQS